MRAKEKMDAEEVFDEIAQQVHKEYENVVYRWSDAAETNNSAKSLYCEILITLIRCMY